MFSINREKQKEFTLVLKKYLHSTMFSINLILMEAEIETDENLHSTMFSINL